MAGIRAVAIDLDGTLLRSDGSLPPGGSAMVRRARHQGIRVVIASTRNHHHVAEVCAELGLDEPIVCTNGARVYGSPSGPLWRERTLPVGLAREMASIADRKGWEMSTSLGEDTFLRRRPGQTAGRFRDHVYLVERNTDAVTAPPLRIIYWQPEAIEYFGELCNSRADCVADTIYKPSGEVQTLCVFGPGADKGEGLRLVLDRLSVPAANTMAVGDNSNDLSMFAVAGFSVAMGNAVKTIQESADVVAPNNDTEGVAWALETYVTNSTGG